MTVDRESMDFDDATAAISAVVANVERVILGKHGEVQLALIPLMTGGHLLLQDVPGVGKSTLAHAIGQSVGAVFHRIQFTSDLLPADILGASIYEAASGEFRFRPGPIFANVVMADEINRASPKTQSALLEAMNDHRVSIDGKTTDLPDPFFVIATQNPVEFTGTYPLPESELDRFQMCVGLGYPDVHAERAILSTHSVRQHLASVPAVASLKDVLAVQEVVDRVTASSAVLEYVLALARATRTNPLFEIGMSPRCSIDLLKTARAWALLQGREYVVPDDVKRMAAYVVPHRVVRRGGRRGASPSDIEQVFEEVPAPV